MTRKHSHLEHGGHDNEVESVVCDGQVRVDRYVLLDVVVLRQTAEGLTRRSHRERQAFTRRNRHRHIHFNTSSSLQWKL